MDAGVTIARLQTTTGKTPSLPVELLERARRRLQFVAGLLLIFIGIDLVTVTIGALTEGLETGTRIALIADIFGLTTCAGLFISTRSKRVSHETVLTLGLVFEVLACLTISLGNTWFEFLEHGVLPSMTWVTPLIIVFPLLVPSRPTRTLATGIIAASTAPLGVAILSWVGQVTATGIDYLNVASGPAMAVLFAYFGSRIIYGLGVDVARARRMGSYELETLLGRGGMGEVWRARHRMLARPAAIKLMRPEALGGHGTNPDALIGRFEREAQATAQLHSPHTIEVYDYGVTDDGRLYYVMELLAGFNLEQLVKKFGPVPPERTVHLLLQVCHSLAEAHENDLIHRDIKPANVYVCRYGRETDFIKVLDFGLVKPAPSHKEAAVELTMTGMAGGTPAFMAPEQVLGKGDVDARTDIYAIGGVAHWLLTGHLVFEGETPMEIMTHQVRTPATPPSKRTELAIPTSLDAIVMACLEKDPERRPASTDELSRALRAALPESRWTAERAQQWWDHHSPKVLDVA